MSGRMIRRLDMITAYGRWLALFGILFVILLTPDSDIWTILIITAIMGLIDAIPVAMLYFKFFPEYAALTFSILDSVFALIVIYLGGPGMFFYCFVPAIAMSIRFDWSTGLVDAAVLAVGYVLIELIKVDFRNVLSVLTPVLFQSLALLLVSAFSGLLAENIKKEPSLETDEAKAQKEKLRRLQAAADRARATYEMASMLSATLDPDKILDAVLDLSTVGFEELVDQSSSYRERPASVVFLFGPEGMHIATSRNIGHEEVDLVVSGEHGVLYKVLSSTESLLLGNLADDPDLRQFRPFRRCRSAMCVPLRAGFDVYGAVLFASPVADAFSEEHLELLTAVSNQAAVAMTNAQLYGDLQAEKELIVEIAEEERTKLARDLHDGPTQSISAIAMRLNFARLLLDREPQKVKDELFKLENLARRTTKEIRTMLFALRPVVLETQGLKVAVEQLVDKLKETGELPVTLEIEDVEAELDVNVKAVAWFITQEALNNAKKYAHAENIWVRMGIRDGRFIAEIQDDGDGFDYEATMATYDQRGSFGLLNFQERADLVNGRTTIQSALGKGTRITLIVPLNREAV